MFVKYVRNYDTVLEYKFACKKHKGSNKYWALRRHVQQDGGGQYTCIQVRTRPAPAGSQVPV